jgi:hypothetical protein
MREHQEHPAAPEQIEHGFDEGIGRRQHCRGIHRASQPSRSARQGKQVLDVDGCAGRVWRGRPSAERGHCRVGRPQHSSIPFSSGFFSYIAPAQPFVGRTGHENAVVDAPTHCARERLGLGERIAT